MDGGLRLNICSVISDKDHDDKMKSHTSSFLYCLSAMCDPEDRIIQMDRSHLAQRNDSSVTPRALET